MNEHPASAGASDTAVDHLMGRSITTRFRQARFTWAPNEHCRCACHTQTCSLHANLTPQLDTRKLDAARPGEPAPMRAGPRKEDDWRRVAAARGPLECSARDLCPSCGAP